MLKGVLDEKRNLLEWSTIAEVNNSYFSIERSDDGIVFYEVGDVSGTGFSSTTIEYSFIDDLPNGNHYYRIKQIDLDGQYEYSEVVFVPHQDTEVVIYPVPTKEELYLHFNRGNQGEYTVSCSNLFGELYREQFLIAEESEAYCFHYVDQLEAGIYFVQIMDEDNQVIKSQKIVRR